MEKNTEPRREATPEELRWTCDPDMFEFKDTNSVPPLARIVGQERAVRALEYGLSLDIGVNPYANIIITGLIGTGRATVIRRKLLELLDSSDLNAIAAHTKRVFGWVYAYNFANPSKPAAIRFKSNGSLEFIKKIAGLREQLKAAVSSFPSRLQNDSAMRDQESATKKASDEAQKNFDERVREINQSSQDGSRIFFQDSPYGMQVLLVNREGQPLPKHLSTAEHEKMGEDGVQAFREFRETMEKLVQKAKEETRVIRERLIKETIAPIMDYLKEWESSRADPEENPSRARISAYLTGLADYVKENFAKFEHFEQAATQPEQNHQTTERDLQTNMGLSIQQDPYFPFHVTLAHQPEDEFRPPVIIESNPKYINLFGHTGQRFWMGRYISDHSMIHGGSLHAANGGYIIINAEDVLRHPTVWEELKRTIRTRRIEIGNPALDNGFFSPENEQKPEPIPFRCKIVLMASPLLYTLLAQVDNEFLELFEVHAPFDYEMPLDEEAISAYASFVSMVQEQKKLPPFDRKAVARIVEEGVRLAGSKSKISTRFGKIQKLIGEAGNLAKKERVEQVEKRHVLQALAAQKERASIWADKEFELITEGIKLIDTEGGVIGQMNGLAVLKMPDGFSFGFPSRGTARAYMGKAGLINIEGEAAMSGNIYDKSFLIIRGFLGATYGQKRPLAADISFAMEQSYGGVEGDSASLLGTACAISALAGLPIKQGIAITGSMNQNGVVQPIGSEDEKIEGFFKLCQNRGLTGEQGVIIPALNLGQLMLGEEVVEAVRQERFHVWPVAHVNEALEVLMGIEAGEPGENGEYSPETIHGKAQQTLKQYLENALKSEKVGQKTLP